MVFTNTQLLVVGGLAALPAVIKVGIGWKARATRLQIAAEVIPELYLPVIVLLIGLPLSRGATVVLIALAAVLGSWGIFNSFRAWRRSKTPAPRAE